MSDNYITHAQAQALVQACRDALVNEFNTQVRQMQHSHATEIAELRGTVNASKGDGANRRPRPVLPDPPLLTGPSDFEVWLPHLEGKLRVDQAAIGTPEAQFMYVYGRLDSKVQLIIRPLLSKAEQDGWDFRNIITALKRLYDDPNKMVRASYALQSMRMKDDDAVRTFLAKWERNAWDAGTYNQPDLLKIQALRTAISPKLQTKINDRESIPDKYDAFVRLILQLATQYNPAQNESRTSYTNYSGKPGTSANKINAVEMDNAENVPGGRIGEIMSLFTSEGPAATKSTPNEQSERRKRNECLRCGSKNHFVRDCPLQPASEWLTYKTVT